MMTQSVVAGRSRIGCVTVGIRISVTFRLPDLITRCHAKRKYATVPRQRPKESTAFLQRSRFRRLNIPAHQNSRSWHPPFRDLASCPGMHQRPSRGCSTPSMKTFELRSTNESLPELLTPEPVTVIVEPTGGFTVSFASV